MTTDKVKRYVVVEIDDEWSDNDAMLELTWLPCAAHFHGLLDAAELQEVAARIAFDETATRAALGEDAK